MNSNDTNSVRDPHKKLGVIGSMQARLRLRHMSLSTEKTYIHWVRCFLRYHVGRAPRELNEENIVEYLSFLASAIKESASTQNQALNAIVFLFREVLQKNIGDLRRIVWAKKSKHLPVVLSIDEVKVVLRNLTGVQWLIGCLLYGTGMRLIEALRLRVKDVDFQRNMIVVRDAKGQKDRIVQLPQTLKVPLQQQLSSAKAYYEKDLRNGFGQVSLPYALQRKYPSADKQWVWQYVFPSVKLSRDPYSGLIKRHHLYPNIMEDSVRRAVKAGGI